HGPELSRRKLYPVNKTLAESFTECKFVAMENGMSSSNDRKVLVSGASFAGLSTAYWMNQLGYAVTVVEIASGLRRGGTAVDIRGNTVDIVKRMGIFEQIKANRLSLQRSELKNADDVTERTLVLR